MYDTSVGWDIVKFEVDKMEKKKIMLVDDEPDFLKITKLNLEQTGKYEVLALSSAKDIISQLNSFKPDVILLDILMPGLNGIETCEMLNSDPMGKDIPLVILSALDKDVDKLRAYKKGALDYLVKPIETDEIIARMEKAIQLRQEKL